MGILYSHNEILGDVVSGQSGFSTNVVGRLNRADYFLICNTNVVHAGTSPLYSIFSTVNSEDQTVKNSTITNNWVIVK